MFILFILCGVFALKTNDTEAAEIKLLQKQNETIVIDLFNKYADFNNATFILDEPIMDKSHGGVLTEDN